MKQFNKLKIKLALNLINAIKTFYPLKYSTPYYIQEFNYFLIDELNKIEIKIKKWKEKED